MASKKKKYHITYCWKDKWQGEEKIKSSFFLLSVLIDSQDGPVPNKTRSNDYLAPLRHTVKGDDGFELFTLEGIYLFDEALTCHFS